MAKSARYKQTLRRRFAYGFLHYLCMLGPLLIFATIGFTTGETTNAQKITFSITTVIAIMLAAITLVVQDVAKKKSLGKTITWTLVIGIIYMLSSLKPFIWTLAICSILDECLFGRKYELYKELVRTNKEIYLNAIDDTE